MQPSWRWFGPNDPITLREIRQAGATDITAEERAEAKALCDRLGIRPPGRTGR